MDVADLVHAMNPALHRLLREPLLHFAVAGAAMFALYAWVNPRASGEGETIVVSADRIASLDEQFRLVWQRTPTRDEREGLIEQFVREEVLYREGLALGLERDDAVVRRRVGQKVAFLVQKTPQPPTERELQAWLDTHAMQYRRPTVYTLQQAYVDPSRHVGDAARAVADVRGALAKPGTDWRRVGDGTMLPAVLDTVTASDVENVFGTGFAKVIDSSPLGAWSGPVRSPYGLHFVRVTTREPGSMPTLADVHDQVQRDVLASRARQAQKDLYQRLRARYVVKVEAPSPQSAAALASTTP